MLLLRRIGFEEINKGALQNLGVAFQCKHTQIKWLDHSTSIVMSPSLRTHGSRQSISCALSYQALERNSEKSNFSVPLNSRINRNTGIFRKCVIRYAYINFASRLEQSSWERNKVISDRTWVHVHAANKEMPYQVSLLGWAERLCICHCWISSEMHNEWFPIQLIYLETLYVKWPSRWSGRFSLTRPMQCEGLFAAFHRWDQTYSIEV